MDILNEIAKRFKEAIEKETKITKDSVKLILMQIALELSSADQQKHLENIEKRTTELESRVTKLETKTPNNIN